MDTEYTDTQLPEVIPDSCGELSLQDKALMINDTFNNINGLANSICGAVTTWKQIDCQMHEMDVQFDMFSKQIDASIEIHRQNAPIVSKQLDAISNMMSRILDKVLVMEASTESEINDKMRLMDSVDQYVDKITTIMTKLL